MWEGEQCAAQTKQPQHWKDYTVEQSLTERSLEVKHSGRKDRKLTFIEGQQQRRAQGGGARRAGPASADLRVYKAPQSGCPTSEAEWEWLARPRERDGGNSSEAAPGRRNSMCKWTMQ